MRCLWCENRRNKGTGVLFVQALMWRLGIGSKLVYARLKTVRNPLLLTEKTEPSSIVQLAANLFWDKQVPSDFWLDFSALWFPNQASSTELYALLFFLCLLLKRSRLGWSKGWPESVTLLSSRMHPPVCPTSCRLCALQEGGKRGFSLQLSIAFCELPCVIWSANN